VWNAHDTLFGSKRCAICALSVYFVHSTRPKIQGLVSRDSIVDRQLVTDWVREWLILRFAVNRSPTSQKIWGGFLCGVYRPGERLWIDSNGKNRNWIFRRGIINTFPSIYNQWISAEVWRPEVARCWKNQSFEVLSRNDPLQGNFQNCVPKGLIAIPIDVLCSNFVKFGRREIGKIVRCLPEKKKQNFAWLSSFRYCTDRAQNMPGLIPRMYLECSRFHPNRFTFGGVISEYVNTIKTGCKVFPVGWSLASSRIMIVNNRKVL